MPYTDIDPKVQRAQAAEIGAALGPEWTVYDAYAGHGYDAGIHAWHLRRIDGLELALDWPSKWKPAESHRISIRPVWPRDSRNQDCKPYNAPDLSITVAQTRPAAEIGREIGRRLIPAYLPWLEQARERAASHNSYAEQTERTKQAILAQEGPHGARVSTNGDGTTVYTKHNHVYSASAQGDSVRFEHMNVPLRIALQILALCRQAPEPQTAEELEPLDARD